MLGFEDILAEGVFLSGASGLREKSFLSPYLIHKFGVPEMGKEAVELQQASGSEVTGAGPPLLNLSQLHP